MFVIQRVLEVEGKLTLLDQNRVIRPHPSFRLFSTANTVGLGDTTGLYHGTQQINQGQMDRWNIVATLNYLPHAMETSIVIAKLGVDGKDAAVKKRIESMVALADLTRAGLHQRRYLDRHVAAHGDHLGGERAHLRRRGLRVPRDVPEQVRRGGAGDGRRILSALLQRGDPDGRVHHAEIQFMQATTPPPTAARNGRGGVLVRGLFPPPLFGEAAAGGGLSRT